MHIEWIIIGKGGDIVEADTAEAAHTALCGAVRDAYKDVSYDRLTDVLRPVYGLRLAMVTDGRTAVEQGREWTAQAGGILVRLSP